MIKNILFIAVIALLISCSKDNDTSETTAYLSSTLTQYDDTNLGIYKGIFTTQGTMERGVLEVNIIAEKYPVATLKLVSGQELSFIASQIINDGDTIYNLEFRSTASLQGDTSFKMSVNNDGTNVQITDAVYNGITSGMIVIHETSRAPVTPITGVLACDDCDSHPLLETGVTGTFNLLYIGDGSGDDTISAIADVGVVITTGGSQTGCIDGGAQTTCDINGGGAFGSNAITWTGTHLYNNTGDCSEAFGTWSLDSDNHGNFTGSFVSDAICDNDNNCNESNPSNGFETAWTSSTDFSQRIATDITIAADTNMSLETVTVNFWVPTGAGITISSANIIAYGDAVGLPDTGNIISSEAGLIPTSQAVIGSVLIETVNFNVLEVVLDLSPITLAGQTSIETTYWISITVVPSSNIVSAHWESTSASNVGFDTASSSDVGVTWSIASGWDQVYNFEGTCTDIVTANADTTSSTILNEKVISQKSNATHHATNATMPISSSIND